MSGSGQERTSLVPGQDSFIRIAAVCRVEACSSGQREAVAARKACRLPAGIRHFQP